LTERRGIGSVSAAQTIVSLSHPGRCRNDAAFAAPRRRQPAQGEQRPNRASPAQPGRGPSSQPRHPHDRRHADALLPNHPGLPQPTHLDPGDVGQAGSQRNFVPSFRCPTSEQFRNLPLAPRMSGHRVRIGATLL